MPTERPTRRSFLAGRVAVRENPPAAREIVPFAATSAGEFAVVGSAAVQSTPAGLDPAALLTSVRRRAMACDWEVQLAARRDDDSMEHVFAAFDLVEAIEAQMTVFRDDSEVMRINRQAAIAPVPVEPRLFELLQLAEMVYRETGGALDITSGPLSETWGFSRRKGRLPTDAELSAALERIGMGQVALDPVRQTIFFRRAGLSVNLNSLGKGYALDRMAQLLADAGVDDYLLHGGKSSVLARGAQPGWKLVKESRQPNSQDSQSGPCWSIGLRHPLRPERRLGQIFLRDEALSTSGAGTQFFRHRGRRYGHILDPLTGWPAEHMYSATVIAPSAAEAEALSTAFFVMGADKVAEYCHERPQLAAVLVLPAEREGEVEVSTFGLDDSRWERLG